MISLTVLFYFERLLINAYLIYLTYFLAIFYPSLSQPDFHEPTVETASNDSSLALVPAGLHKFLKPKNSSQGKDCGQEIIIFVKVCESY